MSVEKPVADALEALKRLAESPDLRPDERKALAEELREADAMREKLADGRVEIAAFGEINAGKSALLNALLGREVFKVAARGGETRKRAAEEWLPDIRELRGLGTRLVVVDTPGLNEVDGAARARIAERTVRQSDLVLFVVKGDLNDVELSALRELHALSKPIILVLNQVDRFRRSELEEALAAIKSRVAGLVADQDIVFAAGRPRPKVVIRIGADGRETEEEVPQHPVVEDLKARILEVLTTEGKAVAALNASLFAADLSARIARLKADARRLEAEAIIERYMLIKASAVALNPVPFLDILGSMGSDAIMLRHLAKVYGQDITTGNAGRLAQDIMGAWGIAIAVQWGTQTLLSLMKLKTFGLSTIVTAVPQGLAAAWTTNIVGKAAHVYFREGGWGAGGARHVIRDVLASSSPSSILEPLKARLEARLRGKPV